MHALWRSIRTARLVLAAYGIAVFMGLIAPAMAQGDLQVVCLGSGGLKMIVVDDDGNAKATTGSSSMVCPLCQAVAPPVVFPSADLAPVSPLAYATKPVVVAHLTALAGAPLPARGPPRS